MISTQNRSQKINGDHPTLPAFTFKSQQLGGGKQRRPEQLVSRPNDVSVTKYNSRSPKAPSSFLTRRRNEVLEEFIKTTEEQYSTHARIANVGDNGVPTEDDTGLEIPTTGSSSEHGSAGSGRFPAKREAKEEIYMSNYSSPSSPRLGPQESSSRETSSDQDHQARYNRLLQHKVLSKSSSMKLSHSRDNHDLKEKPQIDTNPNPKPGRVQRSKSYATSRDLSRDTLLGNRSDQRLKLKLSGYSKQKKQDHASHTDEGIINSVNSSNISDSVSIIPKVNEPRGASHVYPQPTYALHNNQGTLVGNGGVNTGHIITRQKEQGQANSRGPLIIVQNKNTARDLDRRDGIGSEGGAHSTKVDIRKLHRKQQAKAISDKSNEVDKGAKANPIDTHSYNVKYHSNQHDLSSTNGARKTGNDSIELNTSTSANTKQLESINKPVIKTGHESPAEVRGRPIDCSHTSTTSGGHLTGGKVGQRAGGNNGETVLDNCTRDNKEKSSVSGEEIKTFGNTLQPSYGRGGLVHGTLKFHKENLVLDNVNGHAVKENNYTNQDLPISESADQLDQNKESVPSRLSVKRDSTGNYSREYSNSSRASSRATTTSESEGGTPNSSASKLSDRLRKNIRTPILPNKSEKVVLRQRFDSKSHEVLSNTPQNKDATLWSSHRPTPASEKTHSSHLPPPVLKGSSSRNVYLSAQSCENFSNFRKDDFKSALQRLKSQKSTAPPSPVSSYRKLSPRHLNGFRLISETEVSDDFSEDSDVEENNDPFATHPSKNSPHIKDTSSKREQHSIPKSIDKRLNTTRPYLASRSHEKFKSSSLPNMRTDSHKVAMQALPSYAPAAGHVRHEYAQGKPVMKSVSVDSFSGIGRRQQQIDASILTMKPALSQQRKCTDNEQTSQTGMLQSTSLSGFRKPPYIQGNVIDYDRPKTGHRRRAASDSPFIEERNEFMPSETESVSLFSDTCSTASGNSDSALPTQTAVGYLDNHLRSGRITKESHVAVFRDKHEETDSYNLRPKSAKSRDRNGENTNNKGNTETADTVFTELNDGFKRSDIRQFHRSGIVPGGSHSTVDGPNTRKTVRMNINTQHDGKVGYLQKLQIEKAQEHLPYTKELGHMKEESTVSHVQRPKSSKGRQRLSEPELRTNVKSRDYNEVNRRTISSDSGETIHHTSPVDAIATLNTSPRTTKMVISAEKAVRLQQLKNEHKYKKSFKRPDILLLDSPSSNDAAGTNSKKKYNKPQQNLDIDSGHDTDVDGEIEILDLDKLDNTSGGDDNNGHDQNMYRKSNQKSPPGENVFSSRSAGSEASSAWDNGKSHGDYHGNNINSNKQHMFHRQSDNGAATYDRCPVDTPRLTPKEVAIMREHTEREINMSSRAPRLSTKINHNDTSSGERGMHKSNKSSNMYATSDVIDSNNSSHRNTVNASNVKQYPTQGTHAIYKEESSSLRLGKQKHKKLPDVRSHDNENDSSTNMDIQSKSCINGKPSIKPRKLQPIKKMSADTDINKINAMSYIPESAQTPSHKSQSQGVDSNANNSNSTGNAFLVGILTKPKRARSKSRSKSEGLESHSNILGLDNNCLGNWENDSLFDSCYSESPGELTDNSLNLEVNPKAEGIQSWNRRHFEY